MPDLGSVVGMQHTLGKRSTSLPAATTQYVAKWTENPDSQMLGNVFSSVVWLVDSAFLSRQVDRAAHASNSQLIR